MSTSLPRWSLETIYPGPDSPEFSGDIDKLKQLIGAAENVIGDEQFRERDCTGWLKEVLNSYNSCIDLFENLESFVYAGYSVDTTNPGALNALTSVGTLTVPLSALAVRFRNALAKLDMKTEELFEKSSELAGYREVLQEERFFGTRQLSEQEESLAADLARSGADAWGRLQESISSTLSAPWDDGTEKTIVELRNLAFNQDRSIRRKAWEKELDAWRRMETPLAFALNGVKGATVTLNRRRGWGSTLERSTRQNRLSTKALEILISAMEESLPLFRRYLLAKARILNIPRISFYDLFAPVGDNNRTWSFDAAIEFIAEKLGAFDPELQRFVRSVRDRSWIDAQPRSGKVGGAYCIDYPVARESRILSNFDGTYDAMSTLAHELGHAWHSELLRNVSALQRKYPMTLAETASIFNETFVFYRAIEEAQNHGEELYILEQHLQGACQVVTDILSRFYFESDVMDRRIDRELPAAELCELMTSAQERTYGDALNPSERHPFMWAVKGHYYRSDLAFYNFPYAFGQLFGLGLYDRYENNSAGFAEMYQNLLKETGREQAVAVAATAGFDIESPAFWQRSVSRIAGLVSRFEGMVE